MVAMLSPLNFLAVAAGAVLGAWGRWLLALWLNTHASGWPWGTALANLAGAYLIGLVLGLVSLHPEWPAWIRLALVTGLLGALTTFSTFSAETVAMLEGGAYGRALGYAGLSLAGSLALTALGLAMARAGS